MIYTYLVNVYHTTLHPMQCCLIHNSKFQGFTAVQQTLPNITHKSSLLALKINPALNNMPLNYLNLFHVPPILALSDILYIIYNF